jgi:NADPH2:quinone reductase
MRAAWYERNGEAHDVLIVGELPTPCPGPGEVLVRLHTSGINPSDVKARQKRPLEANLIVPHSDGGGVIQAVGSGVSDRRVGQRVWLWNGQWMRAMGTACEFIALPESQAVALPDEADFQIAACLGIPALTALHAIRMAGNMDGKSILVTGAGNAVGHYIVQLARLRGATVIGTAGSEERRAFALSAGVSHLIDYKSESIAERVKEITHGAGVNLIIDMDFSTTADLIGKGVLMSHSTVITYGSNTVGPTVVDFRAMLWDSLAIKAFLVYDLLHEDRILAIKELNDLLRSNQLTHTIYSVHNLDHIVKAHEMVESGTAVGNVLLSLQP